MNQTEQPGALCGIRVLDLTTNYAAYAARLLADLGADVVRVEHPSGDPLRRAGPHIKGPSGNSFSATHLFLNANKKSISLDLGCADGRELFVELASKSDIVFENFPPGTLAQRGMSYERLRRRNPKLIVVSITPYGQAGPRASNHATDLTLLAAGGLLSLGGYTDTGPIAVPGEQGYCAAAIFGAVSAVVGLIQREDTNRGQWIDVAGQECVAFALEDAIPEWYLNARVRQRSGERAREAGTGIYPCRDGYVSIVAGRLGTAKAFITLTEWIAASGTEDGQELLDKKWRDFKFRQSAEGISRFAIIFGKFCASRSKQELYREGQARQIAIAPINTIADLLDNEQLIASGFFRQLLDPNLDRKLKFPGPPVRLQRTPATLRTSAPLPGEHNNSVYVAELGLSEAKLEALRIAAVI